MNLKELVAEIDKTADIANKRLEEIPVNVRGGWGTLIEQNKTKLKTLQRSYKSTLFQKSVGVVLTGDPTNVEALVKLVTAEGEGLVVDAQGLYNRLAMRLEPTFSPARKWGVAQTRKLTDSLMDIMQEVGLKEIPAPAHKLDVALNTKEEVVSYVRKLVREACGDNLNRNYIEELASEQALKIRYNGSVTPVVLLNVKEDEENSLGKAFTKGLVRVNVTSEDVIDKEFLNKTFGGIAKQLKKKG